MYIFTYIFFEFAKNCFNTFIVAFFGHWFKPASPGWWDHQMVESIKTCHLNFFPKTIKMLSVQRSVWASPDLNPSL